ncbi:MAG: hypothetical protein RL657_1309 [Pseudomonadota bacterium]|jgi:Protein of unknown function (DUF3108)
MVLPWIVHRSWWALALAWVAPTVAQEPGCSPWPPEPLTHLYQVQGRASGFPYQARARIDWQPLPDARYKLTYEVKAMLGQSRRQTSEGRLMAKNLEPHRFTDQGRRTLVTEVRPDQGLVILPAQAQPQLWEAGTQDKISHWAQLGGWVACPSTPAPTAWGLRVWGSGETENWKIRVLGTDAVATPWGQQMAIRLQRPAGMGGEARIDWWYVPAWGHLPVRIRVEQSNGDFADQQLVERQPAPSAAAR